jgi:uncharacterized protein (TIGR02594 family)
MAQLPSAYGWLNALGQLPRTISEGLVLLGTHEMVGKGSSRTIMAWRDELNLAGHKIAGYSDDDIPWCGLFAAYVTFKAGKVPVASPLWAQNWSKFGDNSPISGLGDVLVFVRNGGGHVGFYVAEDATAYHVLGGNQGNQVSITRVAKDRCRAHRRPLYNVMPDSVKPYHVAATGGLSKDEA